MKRRCTVVISIVSLLVLVAAAAAEAQDVFTFDWRAMGLVKRSAQGTDSDSTTNVQRSGTGTLTLVRDPSPDVRFALDFTGPDGRGSGFVPRVSEQALDPNFSYPSPLPPGLPPAQTSAIRGSFHRLADGTIPAAFNIVYVEAFVCQTTLDACGGVSSWEVVFIGHAQRLSR